MEICSLGMANAVSLRVPGAPNCSKFIDNDALCKLHIDTNFIQYDLIGYNII
jgi:hypothetical protein